MTVIARGAADQLNLAVRRATEFRRAAAVPLSRPVNPYELCERPRLSVRFVKESSLDGMYCKRKGILLPSVAHRPAGRLRFTCAHELGHHALGHGTKVDEYVKDPDRAHRGSADERAADAFARSLLMPKPAVVAAMARRGLTWRDAGPREIFVAAGELGVGYETLLWQTKTLRLIPAARFETLRRVRPKAIRADLLPDAASEEANVVVVDRHWVGGAVELRVGDLLMIEGVAGTADALLADIGTSDDFAVMQATEPGEDRIETAAGRVTVRACRANYVGLRKHMFKPEVD